MKYELRFVTFDVFDIYLFFRPPPLSSPEPESKMNVAIDKRRHQCVQLRYGDL